MAAESARGRPEAGTRAGEAREVVWVRAARPTGEAAPPWSLGQDRVKACGALRARSDVVVATAAGDCDGSGGVAGLSRDGLRFPPPRRHPFCLPRMLGGRHGRSSGSRQLRCLFFRALFFCFCFPVPLCSFFFVF